MKPLPTDSIKLTTHKVTRHTRSQSPTQTESPTATSSSASSSSSIPIIPTLIIDKEKYTDLEEQFTTSTWTKPQLPNPTAYQNLTHAYFGDRIRLWSTEPPPEPYIISPFKHIPPEDILAKSNFCIIKVKNHRHSILFRTYHNLPPDTFTQICLHYKEATGNQDEVGIHSNTTFIKARNTTQPTWQLQLYHTRNTHSHIQIQRHNAHTTLTITTPHSYTTSQTIHPCRAQTKIYQTLQLVLS